MRHVHYILDDEGSPQPEDNPYVWFQWHETADRIVAQDTVGPVWVSTVFLGINQNYGEGPPILWETLAFVPGEDGSRRSIEGSMLRYETREEALAGHAEILVFLRSLPDHGVLLALPGDVEPEGE